MKKKLLTLITLALGLFGTTSAWGADDSGTLTVTWPMVDASGNLTSAGKASVSDVVSVNDYVATLSKASSDGVEKATFTDATFYAAKFKSSSKLASDNSKVSSTDYLTFSFELQEGVTFTPTGYAFKNARFGTDGGATQGVLKCGDTEIAKTAVFQPSRSGKSQTSANKDITITGATAIESGKTVTFIIYLGGAINGKDLGFADVVITGTYTKQELTTYALNTSVSPENAGTITRNPNQTDYTEGKSVTLTAIANHGYEFEKWTNGEGTQVSTDAAYTITKKASEESYIAVFKTLDTYALTVTANPTEGGTVTKTPNYDAYVEGESVTLTATPATGYEFTNWTDANGNEVATTTSYAYTATTAVASFTANFKKMFSVTYNVESTDKGTSNKVLGTEYYSENTTFTVPTNWYVHNDGYTVTAWNDGEKSYTPGETITMTKDIVLTPVFTANTVSLNNAIAETTVNWAFASKNGAPVLNAENSTLYYVKQVEINGTKYDAAMFVNANDNAGVSGKRGKLNNTSEDYRAQANAGTVYTIPAVKGMVVVYTSTNGAPASSSFKIAGVESPEVTINSKKKTMTYTYEGDASSIDIVELKGGFYPSGISVTYPAAPENVTVTVSNTTSKMGTFSSNYNVDFTNAQKIQAYTATYSGGDVVTLNRFTGVLPAKTGVLLYAPNGTYSEELPVATTAAAVTDNALVGTPAATEIQPSDGTKTNYVLVDGEFRPFTSAGTLAAGKAYLSIDKGDASGSKLSIQFGNGTTGINNINAAETNSGKIYNLNGMEVKNPTQHGIYIQNGKKFIK